MHDIAYIRANPQAFDAALARRGADPVADRIIALDAKKREASTKVQQAQSRRNDASKAIGQAMGQGDKEKAEALKAEVAEIKASMPQWDDAASAAGSELDDLLATLPNLPADDVPDGKDEADNVEVHQWGKKRAFDFEPKEHADLGPALGMDFETGAKLSGARFTFLRGDMARYKAESKRIFTIFRDFSPKVEGLSLDEAFSRVTDVPADLIGLNGKIGTLAVGAWADAVVFERRQGTFQLEDCRGQIRTGTQILAPVTVIKGGRVYRDHAIGIPESGAASPRSSAWSPTAHRHRHEHN